MTPRQTDPANASPTACGVCAINEREHAQRWRPPVGWHQWQHPTQQQIKARMLARRAHRLAERAGRATAIFHTTANWTGSSTDPDDEGEMFCADCRQASCPTLHRFQRRLDRSRWPRRSRRSPSPF